jgi:hypothetical protein
VKQYRTPQGRLYLAQNVGDDPRLIGRVRVVEAQLLPQGSGTAIVVCSTPVEYPDVIDLGKEFQFVALDAAKADEKKLIDATARASVPTSRGFYDAGGNLLPQL